MRPPRCMRMSQVPAAGRGFLNTPCAVVRILSMSSKYRKKIKTHYIVLSFVKSLRCC